MAVWNVFLFKQLNLKFFLDISVHKTFLHNATNETGIQCFFAFCNKIKCFSAIFLIHYITLQISKLSNYMRP